MKHKCICGNLATWYYVPSCISDIQYYACDKCVQRGCSCWYDYEEIEAGVKDDRENYPCIEYDNQKDGFEIELEDLDESYN